MTSPNITVENSERNIKVPSSLKFPVTVSAQSSCDVSITHLVTREQHVKSRKEPFCSHYNRSHSRRTQYTQKCLYAVSLTPA